MNPPHREYTLSRVFLSGSYIRRQSQRSAGTSPIASTFARMFVHKLATSGAPGRMQPSPTIATSAGGGGGGSGAAARRGELAQQPGACV